MLCLKVRRARSFFYLTNAKHLICTILWFIAAADKLLNTTAEENAFGVCGLKRRDKDQVKIYVMFTCEYFIFFPSKPPFGKMNERLGIVQIMILIFRTLTLDLCVQTGMKEALMLCIPQCLLIYRRLNRAQAAAGFLIA